MPMKDIKEAIVLAGGLGTRLRSVVKDLPKPMADIGGKPFLSYLLHFLSSGGVEKAILSTGYKHEAISNYFAARYEEMDIAYSVEEYPLGTGGAIREALKKVRGEDVFVINGDTLNMLDLKELSHFHYATNAQMTIAVRPSSINSGGRYGSVMLDGLKITGFDENASSESGYINAGVYVLKKESLLNMPEGSFSFEKDFLKKNLKKTYAFITDDYFIDIGIPEDYMKAQTELVHVLKGGAHDNLKDAAQDLIFRRGH